MLRTAVATLFAVTSLAQGQPANGRFPQALRHMHHTVWGPEDGVPSDAVGKLTQTPDGYLWFAAPGTLIRFDGARFARIDGTVSP